MKKIVIVDGGPRKGMNTAQLLQRFAEGAMSVGEDVEVKTVRLYDSTTLIIRAVHRVWLASSKARYQTSAAFGMRSRLSWTRLLRRTAWCSARPSILAR